MRRVFLSEVLVCPRCGGTRRLLAAIHDTRHSRLSALLRAERRGGVYGTVRTGGLLRTGASCRVLAAT